MKALGTILGATLPVLLCAACLDFSKVRCRTSGDCISDSLCVAQKCEPRAGRQVTVSLDSAAAIVVVGETRQFSATVSGVSEQGVTWSVRESGGGTISLGGLYTPPSIQGTDHVVATSVADASKSATAAVRVIVPCTDTVTTDCTPVYRLGGNVSGLAGSGLVLRTADEADLAVAASATRFGFSTFLPAGSAYSVSVAAQPTNPWQTCVVSNGSGTMGNGDVNNIVVGCTTNRYALRGSISGLVGAGLVLRTMGEPDLSVPPGSTIFAFAYSLASGSSYAVAVASRPSNPDQDCTVSNASGKVLGRDIADVAVNCLPAPPTGPLATAGNSQVTLTWNAAISGATYNLYRSTTSGAEQSGTKIAGVISGYTDTGLSNGTTYYYVITAVIAGVESSASAEVSATPALPGPALQNLTAVSSTQINLSWTYTPPVSSDSSGYAIYRKDGAAGIYRIVGSVPSSVTSYQDRNLAPAVVYYYKVRYYYLEQSDGGCCSETNSLYSAEGVATTATEATTPAAPSALVASTPGGFNVSLSWTDNANHTAGFYIERSLDNATYSKIGVVDANTTNYIDREVVASKNYWYRVRASNSLGSSGYSAAAGVTTPAVSMTSIGGTVYSSNSTLTLAASPYYLGSSITVLTGAVLTVEAGVEMRFGSGAGIEMRGALISIGTASSHVVFTSSAPDMAAKGSWNGIHIANNQGGSGILKYSTISYASNGLTVDCCVTMGPIADVVKIYDTVFNSCSVGSIGYTGRRVPLVRTAFFNNDTGLGSADKAVYYSLFKYNSTGLMSGRTLVRYSIFDSNTTVGASAFEASEFAYNVLTGNGTGFQDSYSSAFNFSNNLVTKNNIGFLGGGAPTSPTNNNIYDNTAYNYKAGGSASVTATSNWWGSTSATAIKATIWDVYNDANLGAVTYQPFLTAPASLLP
jgi:fibronectin type 3 domain-containing protein